MPQLLADMKKDNSHVTRLLQAFELVRRVAKLPMLMNVCNRPVFQVANPHDMRHSKVVKHMRLIINGADLANQYPEVREPARFHVRAQDGQKEKQAKAIAAIVGGGQAISEEIRSQMACLLYGFSMRISYVSDAAI